MQHKKKIYIIKKDHGQNAALEDKESPNPARSLEQKTLVLMWTYPHAMDIQNRFITMYVANFPKKEKNI